jgi:hypothetical protein
MPIKVALGAGLTLIAIALLVTLSHAPATIANARSVPPEKRLALTTADARGCQRGETLPRDTTAIRLGLFAVSSPEVSVQVYQGSQRIAAGVLGRGWSGEGATVPINELARTMSPVKVCFGLKSVINKVAMYGRRTPPASATISEGEPLSGKISIEYLQPGHRSWWSLAGSAIRHLDLGHAASGILNVLLVIALMGATLALSSWLVLRELG